MRSHLHTLLGTFFFYQQPLTIASQEEMSGVTKILEGVLEQMSPGSHRCSWRWAQIFSEYIKSSPAPPAVPARPHWAHGAGSLLGLNLSGSLSTLSITHSALATQCSSWFVKHTQDFQTTIQMDIALHSSWSIFVSVIPLFPCAVIWILSALKFIGRSPNPKYIWR